MPAGAPRGSAGERHRGGHFGQDGWRCHRQAEREGRGAIGVRLHQRERELNPVQRGQLQVLPPEDMRPRHPAAAGDMLVAGAAALYVQPSTGLRVLALQRSRCR